MTLRLQAAIMLAGYGGAVLFVALFAWFEQQTGREVAPADQSAARLALVVFTAASVATVAVVVLLRFATRHQAALTAARAAEYGRRLLAEERERLKDELISVVTHELRTPLASLLGFSELLLTREYPETERREFLATMLREGRRLSALLDDFLDLQRLEHGRVELVSRPADVQLLVEQAVLTAGDDPARPVRVDVPEHLPRVLVDPDRIQQVLLNLLSNARKYSPDGGEITVSAERAENEYLEVVVRDLGLGIPAEALRRLFEKFYRVGGADRQGIAGTGLGLAITRKIVEAHGGRIWAESAGAGHGSTFRFTLPVARSAGDPALSSARDVARAPVRSERRAR